LTTLVLQIVLAIVVLAGLIATIMSVKGWHWAQMLLLLGVFLSSFVVLLFGLEVFRIHRNIRSKLPALERKIAETNLKIEVLTLGGDSSQAMQLPPEPGFSVETEGRVPGLNVWTRRLQDLERDRGAVWRGVTPSGPVDPATSRVPVTIPAPQPHGLAKDAIVYVFEQGEPSAASPQEGSQYLGEFRVVDVRPDGATLESVFKLDNRTGNRIVASQKPWELYETMPADKHELFAGLTEEKLREMLPAGSVDQYIRDGQTATADDEAHRVGYDEQGQRLGANDAAKAVKWVYERPLKDYAYLFAAANRELIELFTERTALIEDGKKLAIAHENAKKLGAIRLEEQQGLNGDSVHMTEDRKAIETQLATVTRILGAFKAELATKEAEIVAMAGKLRNQQLEALREMDKRAPAPAPAGPFVGAAP
jgi:YD repeat-containing protein